MFPVAEIVIVLLILGLIQYGLIYIITGSNVPLALQVIEFSIFVAYSFFFIRAKAIERKFTEQGLIQFVTSERKKYLQIGTLIYMLSFIPLVIYKVINERESIIFSAFLVLVIMGLGTLLFKASREGKDSLFELRIRALGWSIFVIFILIAIEIVTRFYEIPVWDWKF